MTTSRVSKKNKRSYSLRIPKSPGLLGTSTGFYDRLEDFDYPEECLGWNSQLFLGGNASKSFIFNRELDDSQGKSPLIVEKHKDHRKRSRSLRILKARSPPPSLMEVDSTLSPQKVMKEQGQQIVAHPTLFSDLEEGQLFIEGTFLEGLLNEKEKQKNKKMKHYKKTIDRIFRRGWENFVANLYTVSVARSSPSPTSPSLVKVY
uniref:Uncharacterized protein LOC117364753 n=1 Tax=Geotrypetes seraphini TaxID=260995 RepID=A0A6P8RYJ7_GEOSA|nr:uncharacterized protein LOC117364753 [Geotrypetes seraphini]XP_033810234.1 uncharacterized protein LOC117364753 [Geotrypetes seraphini]